MRAFLNFFFGCVIIPLFLVSVASDAQTFTTIATFYQFGPVSMTQGVDGNFYGSTFDGFFQLTPSGQLSMLNSKEEAYSMLQASDGNFYGVGGGDNGLARRATVYGAALAPGYAGLYQVAIQIPASLANGDYPVEATINSVSSPSTTMITLQR
jgi:hypothetical protein